MSRRCVKLLPVNGPVSIARLHGRACWYCGAVARGLKTAGHVQLAAGARVWTVVSCGCHAKAGAAR
jgi:hypothetical protein